jgi:putative hydrolase of the HAD superfamily
MWPFEGPDFGVWISVKYKAVIFDLFGTLVENFSAREYADLLARLAETLGVPADSFSQMWRATSDERFRGVMQTTEAYLRFVCERLGARVSDEQFRRATEIRIAFTSRYMAVPRPDALPALTTLKSRGYKLGLISDCSNEPPLIWPTSPFAPLFDATIFSCRVGLKKPEPQIYHMATEQLGVKPEECLYVGDGDSHELSGAAQVGMTSVLIRVPGDAHGDALHLDAEDWTGPTITSLSEVLGIVE